MAVWETISRLSREALSRDTEDRSAFLDAACAGDAELRRQIDALIGQPAPDTADLLAGLRRIWDDSNSPADKKESARRDAPQKSPLTAFCSSPRLRFSAPAPSPTCWR